MGRVKALDCQSIAEIDREIVDELEFHVEMRTLDGIRAGMSPAAAREAALAKFGDFERIRRRCHRTLLGERIMLQRIQAVIMVVLLLAVVALGYQNYMAQRANEQTLADLRAALTKLSASAPVSDWHADRPRVVETSPASGATDVDPATSEIRVTFNKAMADRSWSWVQVSKEAFPETAGEIRYLDDMKTCVMPVKLEPGKKYVVWFNTAKFQNFKDVDGRPAEPCLLTFTTRP
jgi:RNA polymerase sigma-70 factor (ECF subfamily)